MIRSVTTSAISAVASVAVLAAPALAQDRSHDHDATTVTFSHPDAASRVQAGRSTRFSVRIKGLPKGVDAVVFIRPRGKFAPMAYAQNRSTTVVRDLPAGVITVRITTRYADGHVWAPARSVSKARVSAQKKNRLVLRYVDKGASAWQEPDWCSRLKPVSDLDNVADTVPVGLSQRTETQKALADRRYPPATTFVVDDPMFAAASDSFAPLGFTTWLHEMSHVFSSGTGQRAIVSATERLLPLSTVDTFPRSEIVARHPFPAKDLYAAQYLQGRGGNEPFDSVLEELNAYVHTLAASYCIRDLQATAGMSTSDRDGVLTAMLYAQLYLRTAREDHPDVYQALVDDAPTVHMLKLIWQRASYYLAVTKPYAHLGINDEFIAKHVFSQENLDELSRIGVRSL